MSSYSEASKWSRNLVEDNQNEHNRLRLIEKQRKILESKRSKQQQVTVTSTRLKSSRDLRPPSALSTSKDKLIDLSSENELQSNFNSTSSSTVTSNGNCSQTLIKERANSLSSNHSNDSEGSNKTKAYLSLKVDKLDDPKDATEIESIKDLETISSNQELNPLKSILNNSQLLLFATQPVSPNQTYQCTIIRDKRGIDRSFYPTYYIHLQAIVSKQRDEVKDETEVIARTEKECTANRVWDQNVCFSDVLVNKRQVFLLGGRRRKKSKTYLISNDPFDITRDNCIAKLKSNVLGTQFHAIRTSADAQRYEIVAVVYETNVLGFKGPRKMGVIVPKLDQMNRFANASLHELWKNDPSHKGLMYLKNKTPVWNEDTQSYVLNFHGRVTQASVKNFQLVYTSQDDGSSSDSDIKDDSSTKYNLSQNLSSNVNSSLSLSKKIANSSVEEEISMQFGRVSDKVFTCDVTWPLSILQAFCIALSSFDSKLACE